MVDNTFLIQKKHGLYGRYDYRDKYKKIYNKRSSFIYN